MSNSLAIAAVTATLYNLLHQGIITDLSGASVTTKPLDKARNGNGNQLNLFLYHTEPNAAWRNMDMPHQVRPGEKGQPPLALSLYYLITAYGESDDDKLGHRILGRAMSILHDHPVLGTAEIRTALPDNDLHEQIERVRITSQPLSLDEMSKLWSSFQTQYRISAAYQVSVVLIESTRPTTAALPVLSRGSEDQGASVLASPSPSLSEVRPPNRKPGAEFGDILSIFGEQLDSDNLTVRFRSPRTAELIELQPLPEGTATEMKVKLPDTSDDPQVPARWPAGLYALSLIIRRPDLPIWTTNEIPFTLAPKIMEIDPLEAPRGDVTLTIKCIPQVRSEQRVVLLFGDREIPVQTISTPRDPSAPTTLTFLVSNARSGVYVLRVRVDGVDSIPVNFTTSPPQFDENQKVTIRP